MRQSSILRTVIDIETIPDESKFGLLPSVETIAAEVSDRYKEETRLAMAEKKRDEMKAACALSPWTGKLASFAWCNNRGESGFSYIKNLSDAQEKSLLLKIGDLLTNTDYIITFNGMHFDLPFIYGRFVAMQLEPLAVPLSEYCRRYTYSPHFDVRLVLTQWDTRMPNSSLSYFSRMILGEDKKEDFDYTMILPAIKSQKIKLLMEYNEKDVSLTMKLFQRVAYHYCQPVAKY